MTRYTLTILSCALLLLGAPTSVSSQSPSFLEGVTSFDIAMDDDRVLVTGGGPDASGPQKRLLIQIEDSLHVAPEDTLDATVFTARGSMVVQGAVTGNILLRDSELVVEDSGFVGGDIYDSDSTLEVHGTHEGVVRDKREMREYIAETLGASAPSLFQRPASPPKAVSILNLLSPASLFVLLIFALAAGWIAPERRGRMETRLQHEAGSFTLAGIGFLALFPFLYLGVLGALVITVVGIPLALAWLFLVPVALVLMGVAGSAPILRLIGAAFIRRLHSSPTGALRSPELQLLVGGVVTLFVPALLLGILSWVGQGGALSALLALSVVLWYALLMAASLGVTLLTRWGSPHHAGERAPGGPERARRSESETSPGSAP